MTCNLWKASMALAALVVSGLMVDRLSANDKERPFRTMVIAEVVEAGESSVTVTVQGQASHLGKVTGEGEIQTGEVLLGAVTLTAANGDLLNFSVLYEFNETTETWQGIYGIEGGTGRFEGATGVGSFESWLNPDGTLTGEAVGGIVY